MVRPSTNTELQETILTPRVTPVRSTGTRTPEGWILLRDVASSYRDGAERALFDQMAGAADLRADSDELISQAQGWAERYHVDPARANIVRGLTIPPEARVLEIGAGCGAVTRYLGEVSGSVDALEPVPERARVARARCRDLDNVEVFVGQVDDLPDVAAYDVIVVVGVLEYVGDGEADHAPYLDFLTAVRRRLVQGGTLALAIENALGVKYLAGAPEDHTNRAFDSLESYPYGGHARTFSRRELEAMMVEAGLTPRTLVAFPDYKMARVVMDSQGFPGLTAPLLHRLPVFPSPDHLTPRARLADERLLWTELCRAGLAAETGNSLLVLAANGEGPNLWPQNRAAEFYSLGRREAYRVATEVVRTGESVAFVRRLVGDGGAARGFEVRAGTEDFVPGADFLEWAAGADDASLSGALRAWVSMVDEEAVPDGGTLIDLVPHNLIVGGDGTLHPFDQEWGVAGLGAADVVGRGLLWLAVRLAPRTPPERWDGLSTVGELVAHLGALAGIDPDEGWIERTIAGEARIQAEIRVAPHGVTARVHEDLQVKDLNGLTARSLADGPLGERAPQALALAKAHHHQLAERLDGLNARMVTQGLRLEEVQEELVSLGIQHEKLRARSDLAVARADRTEAELTAHQHALAEIRGSRAWRIVQRYYRSVDRFAPAGTRRRRLYGSTGRAVARLLRAALNRRHGLRAESSPVFTVPTSPDPVVSIVIPVHGKWPVTEECLRSFVAHPPTVPFEIVVVDDASPDDTLVRLAPIEGVRTVPLAVNKGFIGAVNAGIEASRGEFVVMLNNDTEIRPGWLEALVETGSEPGVGLVGSKLVYPDGRLQEAGGIIFDNGGGWNFGRGDDPNRPMYNFRRDVDYCSGAAILLRRDLLERLGRLDEYFAPAYYDDVDLAFSVREAGLRVVYEPRAVVVHHEGVSHGTDAESGIKAFQEVNRKKLQRKWAHRLTEQMPQIQALVPAAARRRNPAGLIVVIDHHVPQPDEDAGSVRMHALLLSLRGLGYGVLFIPDNRDPGGRWGEVLQAHGIEVLSGAEPLEKLLEDLRGLVVGVIGARVGIAWPYLMMARRVLPGVPFVFDTVDLHHLREEREAHLSEDPAHAARARTTRELELAFVRAADATFVVSPVEKELLDSVVPGARVSVVPTVHAVRQEPVSADGRDGMVFVGSFAHPPNADGIRWFLAEVLPLVRESLPRVGVTVVGRDAPPDVRALADDGVTFAGWVADLEAVYGRARIAIAPLRYGAGLKGKVGEAMSYGVPVVGTSVAAEGLQIEHGVTGWIADDARAFAEGIVTLHRDDELWARVSKAGRSHVEDLLGTPAFERRLRSALSEIGLYAGDPGVLRQTSDAWSVGAGDGAASG